MPLFQRVEWNNSSTHNNDRRLSTHTSSTASSIKDDNRGGRRVSHRLLNVPAPDVSQVQLGVRVRKPMLGGKLSLLKRKQVGDDESNAESEEPNEPSVVQNNGHAKFKTVMKLLQCGSTLTPTELHDTIQYLQHHALRIPKSFLKQQVNHPFDEWDFLATEPQEHVTTPSLDANQREQLYQRGMLKLSQLASEYAQEEMQARNALITYLKQCPATDG
jgi:hypothetical protein